MKQKIQTANKGFISTIIAVSLAIILIVLWLALRQAAINFERNVTEAQPISFAGYYFDNVFEEVRGIIGPAALSIEENNTTFRVLVSDTMSKANFSNTLNTYKNYLETNFSSRIHANVSLNTSNITDGTYELMIDRFQYSFNYTNSSSNSIIFSAINGSAGITNYNVNISVSKTRLSRTAFVNNPAGDINVTLTYTDISGTVTETRTLVSNTLATSNITYTDNSTVSINVGSAANPGQLQIIDNSASPVFTFVASFPLNNATRLLPYYNSLLNYTQGDITRVGFLQR